MKNPDRGTGAGRWWFAISSSLLALVILIATRGDLARIEGLDAFNLDEVSDKGALWLRFFLGTGVFLAHPAVRVLQAFSVALALGMFVFVTVDMRAQLLEFESMGLVPSPVVQIVRVTTSGWLACISIVLFTALLLFEQIWFLLARRA